MFNDFKLPLILILVGTLLVGLGLFNSKVNKEDEIIFQKSSSTGEIQLATSSGKINLNTASIASLISLPGVGEVTAQKIVKARPFGKISDLLEKKIVKNSTYEKLKELVSAP